MSNSKIFVSFFFLMLCLCVTLSGPVGAETGKPLISAMLDSAGNADTDEQRLQVLKNICQLPNLDQPLKEDAQKMIQEIERWLESPRLDYFDRQVRKIGDYDFGIDESSPLFPLTLLYQARMNFWCTMEHGDLVSVQENRRKRFDHVKNLLTAFVKKYPDNQLARMYLGEPIAIEKKYHAPESAPEWAVYQREGLERLTDIIEWWIDNRQQADGQYGGGWGDDCEMWRWWAPVLIGFENPKMVRAQEKLSRAIMNLDYMRAGYYGRITDVEHSAEESADALTPMMILEPENSEWSEKALHLADFMNDLWTGENERGFRQFKSIYFSSDSVVLDPKKSFDTVYHPRAVQPALLYWLRTGDENLTPLFTSWMDAWVDATRRAENGKPAGIIPSAIHWPDGGIGIVNRDWWNPEGLLYRWPSAMSLMTETMLLTYHMTQNSRYLEPIFSMSQIRQKYVDGGAHEALEPGSEDWCASRLGWLSRVLAKVEALSDSVDLNFKIKNDIDPYLSFRTSCALQPLTEALKRNSESLSINFAGFTSEVRYTDRVLRFPAAFGDGYMFEHAVTDIGAPNPALLYRTVGGDPAPLSFFPLNAVRWLTPSRDIATLVVRSDAEKCESRLYHFGKNARSMAAEFYLLKEGVYDMMLFDRASHVLITEKTVLFDKQNSIISFLLPSQKECTLVIEPVH